MYLFNLRAATLVPQHNDLTDSDHLLKVHSTYRDSDTNC